MEVQASGLYGYLNDSAADVDDLTSSAGTENGLYLLIEPADAGANLQTDLLELDETNSVIQTVPEEDTFYLIVDTGAVSDIEDGEMYEAEFRVGDADADTTEENPYVDDDEEEAVTTEFSVAEPDAEFNNVADGTLQVASASEATVSGTTNVAPGPEVTVELRKTGDSPSLLTQTVTVAADGTFSAAFDTSEIPVNTEFTAVVQDLSDEVNGMIVEQVSTETPPPTEETPTATEPSDTPTAEPDTPTETGVQPGFDVAIAIVALLTAALLSIRRD